MKRNADQKLRGVGGSMLQPKAIVPQLAAFHKGYRNEILFPGISELLGRRLTSRSALCDALEDPGISALVFLGYFAFARAGGEQAGYGGVCARLLRSGKAYLSADRFLGAFRKECQRQGIGPNEKLNAGVIRQAYEDRFKSRGTSGWLYRLGRSIQNAGQVIPAYLELVRIRGIGAKIAAFVCRDLVWIFGCEESVPPAQRILIQPIDTWLRQIGPLLWPEFERAEGSAVDILLAMRICAVTAELHLSDVEFNQGAWYFGSQVVRDGEKLAASLRGLTAGR